MKSIYRCFRLLVHDYRSTIGAISEEHLNLSSHLHGIVGNAGFHKKEGEKRLYLVLLHHHELDNNTAATYMLTENKGQDRSSQLC